MAGNYKGLERALRSSPDLAFDDLESYIVVNVS